MRTDHMRHEGGHRHGHDRHAVSDLKRRFWISLALTAPVLMLSPMIQRLFGLGESLRFRGDQYVLFGLASVVFGYGGLPFLRGFLGDFRARRPGMMTLIAVAITTAYVYSAGVVLGLAGSALFWELATLVDVMLLGHWIELKSVMGASRALDELARLVPARAHKLVADGAPLDVPLSELEVGDRVVVKPGEKIPADGRVLEGRTSVNEALLTGESKPVWKEAGAKVIGGALNGEGSITVEVGSVGERSFIAQVAKLVREAQASKSRTQDLADRSATWLTVVALGGGALTLVGWLALTARGSAFALERAVTVMVIACPHALGLAVPLVVAVSTALGARHGLLVRNRAAFERARTVRAVVFDKTGTLTEGKFSVTDVIVLSEDLTGRELLRLAASVEARSEHPVARAIASSASDLEPVEDFRSVTGRGAQGRVAGREVMVVGPGYSRDTGAALRDERVSRLSAQGKTIVFVILDGAVKGAVALDDIVRPESKRAVSLLRGMGIRCMMLTGDNAAVAQRVSGEIGLDEYFAEVLPQEKASKIREIQGRGLIVAMAGDGVNDAPALAQADVGIAIGAGTDIAIEAADVVLVNSNPLDAVSVIGLARSTYRKMIENLAWATGYNVLAIPLAAGVLHGQGIVLSPALGAVLMSASTLIVAINARFLKLGR